MMVNNMTTWRKELTSAKEEAKDQTPIIALAPNDVTVWDQEFYPGYGRSYGAPVLAWTEARVYFPVVYDGAEWLESVPRNPVSNGRPHVGGE